MPEVRVQGEGMSPAAMEQEFQKIESAKAELAGEYQSTEQAPQENLILGKFRSVDDLTNAYRSLQAEYTRLKQGAPAQQEQQEVEPVESDQVADEEQPAEEEQQEEAPAVNPEVFTRLKDGLMESAGGESKFNVIRDWANQNLPEERKAYFNNALQEGRVDEAITAFKSIQYDYLMQNGWEPKPLGGRAPVNQVRGFRSEGEVKAAMNDPRYDSTSPRFDRAYHDDVMARLAASNVFEPM